MRVTSNITLSCQFKKTSRELRNWVWSLVKVGVVGAWFTHNSPKSSLQDNSPFHNSPFSHVPKNDRKLYNIEVTEAHREEFPKGLNAANTSQYYK